MAFHQYESFTSTSIGVPIFLHRGHLDPALVTLIFHYEELTPIDGVWITEHKQQVLEEGTHYSLNNRDGQISLLDHPFWQQEGRWRAADRIEPLLYEGQVKHPQQIEFSYEHYRPLKVKVKKKLKEPDVLGVLEGQTSTEKVNMAEIDTEAQARLGYPVLKYQEGMGEV